MNDIKERIEDVLNKETVIGEAARYPTEDEAKYLVSLRNALDGMSWGAPGEMRAHFDKVYKLAMQPWEKVFGDKSPWKAELKGKNRKFAVKWDKFKADKLGL